MLVAIISIFALDPSSKLAAETFISHSGSKFMFLVVPFHTYFWLWCQTEIISKEVYAAIWPVLEVTSLNTSKQLQLITFSIVSRKLKSLYSNLYTTYIGIFAVRGHQTATGILKALHFKMLGKRKPIIYTALVGLSNHDHQVCCMKALKGQTLCFGIYAWK